MTPRARKRLSGGLRIGICGGALWIVIQGVTFHDHVILRSDGAELVGTVVDEGHRIVIQFPDGRVREVPREELALNERGQPRISYGLKSALQSSHKLLLLLALLLHLPVALLQAVRFQWLLIAQSIRISYWECVKLSFAGNFLNFATPLGSNAGDVFKAYFVTTHTDRKTEAVTTVALDRAIGLGTLIACVAAITGLSSGASRLAEFRPYVLTALGIGVAGVFAYFSPTLRKHLIPRKWLTRLPMFEQLRRVDQAAHALASHKPIIAASVLATVALQVLAIGAYFTVAVALGLDAHLGNVLEYYAYFYTGAVIQALPGPPQGLGTVELAYRYFFAAFGSPSQIVCVAFLARIVVLTSSLPGLLVTLTGSYRPNPARLPDNTLAVR
jgi:uncharacterized protein (TIRG00374 family)